MSRYYDRKGKPMGQEEWANAFCEDNKRVAFDRLEGCEVSTVWLGLDHQFGKGPPLIFETMVFGGPLDQEMERYSTEDEALTGHASMVERARAAGVKE